MDADWGGVRMEQNGDCLEAVAEEAGAEVTLQSINKPRGYKDGYGT